MKDVLVRTGSSIVAAVVVYITLTIFTEGLGTASPASLSVSFS